MGSKRWMFSTNMQTVWESMGPLLTYWGRDRMAAISQTTFSNAFSWMKFIVSLFIFPWNMLPRVQLSICQHWFRWWLGNEQATSHYLNQCGPIVYWCIYASLGLNGLMDKLLPICLRPQYINVNQKSLQLYILECINKCLWFKWHVQRKATQRHF